MIILDVETTGTDPLKHSLVSIGALDFSSPEIRFYEECRIWEGAHIMPAALEVNGYSEEEITNPQKQSEGELIAHFLSWLFERESMVIAGQNVFLTPILCEQELLGQGKVPTSLIVLLISTHLPLLTCFREGSLLF